MKAYEFDTHNSSLLKKKTTTTEEYIIQRNSLRDKKSFLRTVSKWFKEIDGQTAIQWN